MKNNIDKLFEKSFESLNEVSTPTSEQKRIILQRVLIQSQSKKSSVLCNFKNMIVVYPWRFAFGASALQATILTIIFGSNYINFILQFMGR